MNERGIARARADLNDRAFGGTGREHRDEFPGLRRDLA